MLLTVYDKYFKRVNVLRKYRFAQYIDKFRDIGEFTVYAMLDEENMYFFDKDNTYYINFEGNFFGKVESVVKEEDSEYSKTINITGRAISFILDKRVVYKQQTYSGTPEQIIKSIMDTNIRAQGARFLDIVTSYDTLRQQSGKEVTEIDMQKTGGTVFGAISGILQENSMGFDMRPVITSLHLMPGTTEQTNIENFKFDIMRGRDLRFGNPVGNVPVIFAQSYSNLRRASYERGVGNFCNIAYVAGEGEGSNRKWIEVLGPTISDKDSYDSSGWYRYETFVDARDLQSQQDQDTQLTPAEYESLLRNRGLQSLANFLMVENFEATIVNDNNRYIYGKDFYKGDYVTIRDVEIGLDIGAQITEITRSVEGTQETFDIVFGNQTITVIDRLRKGGIV